MSRPFAFKSILLNRNPVGATGGQLFVGGTPVVLSTGAQAIEGAKTFLTVGGFVGFDSSLSRFYAQRMDTDDTVPYHFSTVDFNSQQLFTKIQHAGDANDTQKTLDWDAQILYRATQGDTEGPSLDWLNKNLIDNQDKIVYNWDQNVLYGSFPDVSIDVKYRSLKDTFGTSVVNWEYGTMSTAEGTLAVTWFDKRLIDDDYYAAVDWKNHVLKKYDTVSVDWANHELRTSVNGIGRALDWEQRTMFGDWSVQNEPTSPSGVVNVSYMHKHAHTGLATTQVRPTLANSVAPGYVLAWMLSGGSTYYWSAVPRISASDLRYVYDTSNIMAVDGPNRQLSFYSSSNGQSLPTVDWQNQQLKCAKTTVDPYNPYASTSPVTVTMVDWMNGVLYSENGGSATYSMNWNSRLAYDAGNIPSFSWGSRTAYDTVGSTCLMWGSRSLQGRWHSTSLLQTITSVATNIDWATAGYFTKTLTANTTFTFTNLHSSQGQEITVAVTNNGSWTVTWPAGIKWVGGTTPVQTVFATVAKTDIYTFWRIGSTIYAKVSQNHF